MIYCEGFYCILTGMSENIIWNNSPVLEAEIVELTRQIEEKRRQLETESGIISDRELVAETIAESFTSTAVGPSTTAEQIGVDLAPVVTPTSTDTYLDGLDGASVVTLNSLIAMVPDQGVGKAIATAATHGPFILDAFHDVLVDKLYSELQVRGVVK